MSNMSANKLLEKHIVNNGLLSDIHSNIDYIQEYGDISLYYCEDEVNDKMCEIEHYMEQVSNLLNEICIIIKDNYEV